MKDGPGGGVPRGSEFARRSVVPLPRAQTTPTRAQGGPRRPQKGSLMFVIRDIFNTKPGRAKDLVAKMKKALPLMHAPGAQSARVMTDTVAGYWTVVCETEVEDLKTYFDMGSRPPSPEAEEAMKGYMDLVNGGRREIFRIE